MGLQNGALSFGFDCSRELELLIYSRSYLPHPVNDAIYAVAAAVILIGLWLLSRIARYAGAAFYFLFAGVVAFCGTLPTR
jgi:hypothetical protein